MTIINIVMWETAQHCRLCLFQDSDFAGDFEDSKLTSGGVLFFWKSNFSPSQLDVRETIFDFAQFSRVRNHFSG